MKKLIFLVLTALFTLAIDAQSQQNVPLGMNSSGNNYYSADIIFKNLMINKADSLKGYDTGGQNRVVPLVRDADGWPVSNLPYAGFQWWVSFNNSTTAGYPGDYTVMWKGTGNVAVPGFVKTSSGDHRFTINVPSWPLLFTVQITKTDSTDPVRDIVLVQSKYVADYLTQPYHPDYIAFISHFAAYRFMDLSSHRGRIATYSGRAQAVTATTLTLDNTASAINDFYKDWFLMLQGTTSWPRKHVIGYNGTTKVLTFSVALDPTKIPPNASVTLQLHGPVTWADRTSPTSIRQNGPKGMAIEHMVGIANAANVAPWFSLPQTGDDSFILGFGQYLKANLKPGLKAYIEWNNETWGINFGFDVATALGEETGVGGAWQYHALRATQIFHILNGVYNLPDLVSKQGPNPLVRVLATQLAAAGSVSKTILDFKSWLPTDPPDWAGHKAHEFADALAGAPYFGWWTQAQAQTLKTSQLLDLLQGDIARNIGWSTQNLALTQARNIQLITYEGGLGTAFSNLSNEDYGRIEARIMPAYRSNRMRALHMEFLKSWSALGQNTSGVGVGLFLLYNAFGPPTKFGYWPYCDDQLVPECGESAKWVAVKDYLSGRLVPVSPSDISVSANGWQSAVVRWEDNSYNETGFTVERKAQTENTFTRVATLPANTTSFTDSTLLPGVSYTYRVNATNGSGPSEFLEEVTTTTPLVQSNIPESPRDVLARVDTHWSLVVEWSDLSNIESDYIVERKDPGAANYNIIATLPANTTYYIDTTGIQPGKLYSYRVTAALGQLKSTPSMLMPAAALVAHTFPGYSVVADAPQSFTAVVSSPTTVKLTWVDKNTTEIGYTLQRKLVTDTNFTTVATLPANTVQYIDSNLAPGLYVYQLNMTRSDLTTYYGGQAMVYVPSTNLLLPKEPKNLHVN